MISAIVDTTKFTFLTMIVWVFAGTGMAIARLLGPMFHADRQHAADLAANGSGAARAT